MEEAIGGGDCCPLPELETVSRASESVAARKCASLSAVATMVGSLTDASSLPSWCRVQPPPLRRSTFISTQAFRSMISALVSYFHSLQCERLLIDPRAENALAITNSRNCSSALSSPPVHLPSPLRRARTPARRSASYACLASPAPAPPLPRLGRLVLSHAVRTTSTLLRGLSGSNVSSRKPTLRENSLFFLPLYSLASTC